jgi:hypothetical protein
MAPQHGSNACQTTRRNRHVNRAIDGTSRRAGISCIGCALWLRGDWVGFAKDEEWAWRDRELLSARAARVLLVDDDQEFSEAVTAALARRGFRYAWMPSAERALSELSGSEHWDVVLRRQQAE